jgi:hypothetical protein
MTSLIPITSHGMLTDTFIFDEIPDELYKTTKAYKFHGDKQSFCNTIFDNYARYLMLKTCLKMEGDNLYNKIIHLIQ